MIYTSSINPICVLRSLSSNTDWKVLFNQISDSVVDDTPVISAYGTCMHVCIKLQATTDVIINFLQ